MPFLLNSPMTRADENTEIVLQPGSVFKESNAYVDNGIIYPLIGLFLFCSGSCQGNFISVNHV